MRRMLGGSLENLPQPLREQPSILRTLPTFEAVYSPEAITVASAAAVILALLVAFPSALLDSAAEQVAAWSDERRARKGKAPRDPAARPPLTLVGWPAATVGLLVAAAASAYVEPDFGPTLLGVQTAVGILVSYIVVVAFGWAFVGAAMWLGHRHELPRIEFRPLTLLVVGAAVVFSRLSGFEPGIIFGLIAGVGFGAAVSQVTQARAAVLTLVYTMTAAGVGWFGYSTAHNFWGDDLSWTQAIAMESLAAITIAGLAALPIALLPMRGLTGHAVWAWNRWAWGFAYALSLAAFLWVLMPLPDSWQEVSLPLKAWLLTYAAYAAVSVLAWLIICRPWHRPQADTSDDVGRSDADPATPADAPPPPSAPRANA